MADPLLQRLQTSLGTAYTLERELGGGGMSRVFVAREEALQREVVVKVLTSDHVHEMSAERFAREIHVAARLQDPHIVPVLAAGTTSDGLPYYTMPFVRGQSLRARLGVGRVMLPEAVGILRDVARALSHAHAHGVVHRDVKPENVLLSDGTAVVTDFGIAKALADARTQGMPGRISTGATLTEIGKSVGTPAYMSPEQAAGDVVDRRTDVYAWGLIAYELLAGRHPFASRLTSQQLLAAQISETPEREVMEEHGTPDSLADLVMRCLAKDPEQRPQSASELLAALNAIASDSFTTTARRPRARLSARWLVGIGLAIAAVGAFALVVRQRMSPSSGGSGAGNAAIRSVAVLPFENIGGDSSDAYLAHGLTDELAVTLGTLPELRVAPRITSRVLHAKGATASEIARQLNVQGVLAGTVRRGGDRLRVTAELVNAATGERVWSEQFEEDRGDVFGVEDRVTRAIVSALRLRLAGGGAPQVTVARGTRDPEAYDLYLRGRYFWSLRSEESIRRAIDYFTRAAGRDSDYVLAISGLADAYAVSAFYSYVPPMEGYGRAKTLARRALRLDSTRAEPHASLGYVALYYDRDWAEADQQLRRAIRLDSNYATAHQWYGNYLVAMNQPEAAVASLRRAQHADPLNRVSVGAVCWGMNLLREYREALAQCGRALEIDSTFALAWLWRGQSSSMLGDTVAAFRDLEHGARLSHRGAVFVAALAHAQARAGHPARARELLGELAAGGRYVPPYEVALVHAALGERAQALGLLERAYTERTPSIVFIRVDPALDPLRGEARFKALLERMR